MVDTVVDSSPLTPLLRREVVAKTFSYIRMLLHLSYVMENQELHKNSFECTSLFKKTKTFINHKEVFVHGICILYLFSSALRTVSFVIIFFLIFSSSTFFVHWLPPRPFPLGSRRLNDFPILCLILKTSTVLLDERTQCASFT